jgi:hypothetical protein
MRGKALIVSLLKLKKGGRVLGKVDSKAAGGILSFLTAPVLV